ncbi:hypothetical protein [Actinoplanes sp. GCM10030250]|uniref:hypothetical protein n=1 Tax=Actinoplanes sp. GCM10030250 TaxID=3273376 RepID=UPI0036139D51
MDAENPYAEQTSANTSTPWLDDGPGVDVDLDGLTEYARHMADQQADIASRAPYLASLGEMPGQAWRGDVLGEADAVRAQLVANAGELSVYLGKLGASLGDVGRAARAIAEQYRSGDAVAAASLSDVLNAFAPRPAQPAPAADSPEWRVGVVTPVSAQQTVETSAGPGGERREITTFTAPGGATTTTTTVIGRGGGTSTTRTSERTDGTIRITTEETFGADGTLNSTTETRQGYGETTVTEIVDSGGRTTSLTEEKVDPATGESTTSTYRPSESGLLEETNRVRVGARTSDG